MTTALATLNPAAQVALASCEQRIERGLKTFIDLGIATTGGPVSPGRGEHVDPSPRPDFPGGEGGGPPVPAAQFRPGRRPAVRRVAAR